MADEATPTETSVTEPTPANDAAPASALGGAGEVVEAVAGEAAPAEVAADPKSDAQAPAADAAPEVPDAYELTASEGVTLDPVALEAATPVFKELGLSNDQANKLMPVAEAFAKSIGDNLNRQILDGISTQHADWLREAKADTEIGGKQWDASLVTAAKGLDTLGFPKGSPLRNLLDESGLGNHPEMIRAFVKVGKLISEDSDFPRGNGAKPVQTNVARIMYPNDAPKG